VNGYASWAIDSMSEFDTNQVRARLEQREKSVIVRPFALVRIDIAA
jgi:hypothetical protein